MIPCFTVDENLRHTLRLRGIRVDNMAEHCRRVVEKMLIDSEET